MDRGTGAAPGARTPPETEDKTETLPAVLAELPLAPAAVPGAMRYRHAPDSFRNRATYRYAEALRDQLAALPTDPRLPGRAVRCLLAAAAGTLLGIVVNWGAGLAAAVAATAAGWFFSFRTSAVIPASVRARSAQRRTGHRLARLAGAGYLTLHGRQVPGTGSVIEHLVIGPAGVYAVGSQHWDRRLPVRATGSRRIFHGPFDETGRLDHTRYLAEQAATRIGGAIGRFVTVRPALAIYGPPLPWPVMEIAGVDVFCGRRLRRYLRRAGASGRANYLTIREIELIHGVAGQVLPPAR